MKSYPSIPASTGQSFAELKNAYIFDKLDGSNLRWEWSKKQGWHKFGTRTRLFDATDAQFGVAVSLFHATLAEPLTKIAVDSRWERVVVFTEFWGPQSFAGVHVPGDDFRLTVFDAAPHKKGLLGPRDFLKVFADRVATPKLIGRHNWTRDFIQGVREGRLEGVTDEGVVAKVGEGHQLQMAKAKTQTWIDKVLARYGAEEGQKIAAS